MTTDQEAEYSVFLHDYEHVREAEGWGGDDLDLPFAARRNRYVWSVRKRTFRKFSEIVAREFPDRGTALDVAAGNGWLSKHLASWGFVVTALDVNVSNSDGLGAATHYLSQGFKFERVRAPAEALPFADGSFDLIVVAGAFHYLDGGRVLEGFRRVLRDDGRIIVFDSPWYERAVDGDRAFAQRVEEQSRTCGITMEGASRSSYLLRSRFEKTSRTAGFEPEISNVWTGPRRSWDTVRARMKSERIAKFPLIVLRARNDESIG